MNLCVISSWLLVACVITIITQAPGVVGETCNVVKLSECSIYPVLDGKYAMLPDLYCNKKHVYVQKTSGVTPGYFYFVSGAFTGWVVGSKWCRDPTEAYVRGSGDTNSPDQVDDGIWEEKYSENPVSWTGNTTVTVTCEYELGPWEIAGIVVTIVIIGSIVLFVIVVCCCNCCTDKKKKQQQEEAKKAKEMTEKTALKPTQTAPANYQPTSPPNMYNMPQGPYDQPAAPPPVYTVDQPAVPPIVYPVPQTTMPQPQATTPAFDPYTGLKPKE